MSTNIVPISPRARYQAAESSQYHKAPPRSGAADLAIARAHFTLRDWARWLDENLDFVSGSFDKLVNFIVGQGITIEPMVRDRKGNLLEAVNKQIKQAILDESAPESWSRDCNVNGEYTRGEQERIACRTSRHSIGRSHRGRCAFRVRPILPRSLPRTTEVPHARRWTI